MKREIKFKCWDKILHKWIDIYTHKIGVQLTDVGFAMSTGYDSEDNPTWDFSKVEFNRYEFPQFTGLHDCQGKEIYEGDIVKESLEGKLIWDGAGLIEECPYGKVEYESYYYNIVPIKIGRAKLTLKNKHKFLDNNGYSELHLSRYDGMFE